MVWYENVMKIKNMQKINKFKKKKVKPWDKKGHTKLYSDILTLPIISRQIKKKFSVSKYFSTSPVQV
jgi:hypothetical protein